jgi:C-terminal processing protease CtpA/Prc
LTKYDGITESEFIERLKAGGDPGAATGLSFHEHGVAVMRIAHWDSGDASDSVSAQLPRWFQLISDHDTKSLIIDVRNNGGGEETVATELLSYLVAAPFRYYDCAVLNGSSFGFLRYVQDDGTPYAKLLPQYARVAGAHCRHFGPYELTNRPNLGLQQPRIPHFAGQIYLLVDAGSFSTSAEFAATLRTYTQAVIIGQETSGNYYGDNSGITIPIVLPHSRLVLEVPTVAYYLAVRKDLPVRSGVMPNVTVVQSVRDILLHRDTEMATAMNLIEDRR